MVNKSSLFLLLAAASVCVACAPVDDGTPGDQEEEDQISEARQALLQANASQLNGTVANTSFLNGVRQNGVRQNGVRQNGVRQNGVRQNSAGLEGTDEDSGLTIGGTGYIGATMEAVLGDSSGVVVDIVDIVNETSVGLYTYEIELDGVNVCGSTGARAVLVPGIWDYATASHLDDGALFTVACDGAAIAKCLKWGYATWSAWTEDNGTDTQDVSFWYFHQACTRMVRADYCGDGAAHTETGTTIEVWDAAGIQEETPGNTLPLEAEWSAGGATCVKHVRWTSTTADPGQDVEDYIDTYCPSRWAGPESSSCGGAGSEFFTGNGFKSSPTYVAPHGARPLLRNASDQHTH